MTKKKSKSNKEKRRQAQLTGFKKTDLPFDTGFEKPHGKGRSHKPSTRGKVHRDKADPHKDPIRHLTKDVIGKRLKKLKFW